jgi:lipopolysaccharide cholinephosphotransferase
MNNIGMKQRFLSADEFRRLQLVELEVLIELDRVCRKYAINYVIFCGTQLGAIRHKGFIPWDDDIDVAMLREDYERFKSVSSELNPSICFFQDHETDPEYRWGFAKVRRTGTTYIRLGQEHIKQKTGIFMDIFPLDDVPRSVIGQVFQDAYCYCLRKVLWSEVGKYQARGIKKLWFRLISHISPDTVYRWLKPYVRKSHNHTSNAVRTLLFPAFGKLYVDNPLRQRYGFPKEWILERAEYLFEGRLFYGTKDYDAILKYIYKDYMTPPPENKRQQHAPVSYLDFGEALVEDKNLVEPGRDIDYWNHFYKENPPLSMDTSPFAQFVSNYLAPGRTLVDLGCGNGRDSLFFSSLGLRVTGIDLSWEAIDALNRKHINGASFVCADFVSEICRYQGFDYAYSRFSLHAIDEIQEKLLIKNIYSSLTPNGLWFIEVRSVKDELFGKGIEVGRNAFTYGGHYRRFIVMQELLGSLSDCGFVIKYSEQKKGFAPFMGDDPEVLRIIAEKASR